MAQPASFKIPPSKRRANLQEDFRQATSATLRALSGNRELEAVFASNARGKIGTDVFISSPSREMTPGEQALVRGECDQNALREAHHDEGLHHRMAPVEMTARSGCVGWGAIGPRRCVMIRGSLFQWSPPSSLTAPSPRPRRQRASSSRGTRRAPPGGLRGGVS